jgi:hypothetical protein
MNDAMVRGIFFAGKFFAGRFFARKKSPDVEDSLPEYYLSG